MPISPPSWADAELAADRASAVQRFREARTGEPLDDYLEFYERAVVVFEAVMSQTDDLLRLRESADAVLLEAERQDLCRYLVSPPLSADDLKTLADCSLAPRVLAKNPAGRETVIDCILLGLDRARFPWVREARPPTEAERSAATVATCAMFAMRKTETARRAQGKGLESQAKEFLTGQGFTEVPGVVIANASQGPGPGEFCGETSVVGGKADLVLRLHDGRLLLIECKVSNSETNSYKRLIHDCGEKAQAWVQELGPANCAPVALLAGCYSLGNLNKAQDMGLGLIWAHNLAPLGEFIGATRGA